MSETVAVTIEVEAAAAAAMADARTRAAIGRLVSRVLNPQPGPSELAQAIAAAKAAGVLITCEVSPHHLLLTHEDVRRLDTRFKMNPPLRAERDRQALIDALPSVLDAATPKES